MPACPMCDAPNNGEEPPEKIGALDGKMLWGCGCCGSTFGTPLKGGTK